MRTHRGPAPRLEAVDDRKTWMDLLRGGAVLLVALWHAFEIPYPTVPAGIAWLFDALSVARIPTLMFLSGLLLDHSLRKPTGVYVAGKLRRIAWPLVVWSAVLVIVGWPAAQPGSPWFWLGDGAHLWYLGVLLACYAVGLLTRWVHPLVFFVVGFVAMETLRTDLAFVNNTLWFGLYFFAGATMARWLDRWLRLRWYLPAACLVVATAWAVYSATVNGYAPIAHWRPLLLSLLGVVGVVWFATRLPRVRWLEWVGRRSIVYYVAHVPFIWAITVLVAGVLPLPATYAVVVLVMLGGCTLLARYLGGSILFEFPRLRAPGRATDGTAVAADG
ncbi:hypothetical protein GCM10009819_34660 [Agromyces tropicus]|uniref:Acyltransferase 3 domain-containing protein n=1 Tax=Agromyces tropicus TaxID=555371 RepID=A0ABN2UW08_9MICO